MTLKLDKAGRILLPKRIRDRLGLKPGSELTIEESAEGVLLRAAGQQPVLVQRRGLLIHRGEALRHVLNMPSTTREIGRNDACNRD